MSNWSGKVCLTQLYINFVFLWGDFVLGMSSALLDLPFNHFQESSESKGPMLPSATPKLSPSNLFPAKVCQPHALLSWSLGCQEHFQGQIVAPEKQHFSVGPLPHFWTWTEIILSKLVMCTNESLYSLTLWSPRNTDYRILMARRDALGISREFSRVPCWTVVIASAVN